MAAAKQEPMEVDEEKPQKTEDAGAEPADAGEKDDADLQNALNEDKEDDLAKQLELQEAQQKEIDNEVKKLPLIGSLEKVDTLLEEYKDNKKFLPKIKEIATKFPQFRRIRGDGNCFYRAFLAGLLLTFVDGQNFEKLKKLRERTKGTHSRLIKLGYPDFTTEDFYENWEEALDWMKEKKRTIDETVEYLSDEINGPANYLVIYAKLLVSLQLKENPNDYEAFLGGKTIAQFCKEQVEPSYAEADNMCIMGLMTALGTGIGVSIGYLDQSERLHYHKIPDKMDYPVHLLYRPGHYDLLIGSAGKKEAPSQDEEKT